MPAAAERRTCPSPLQPGLKDPVLRPRLQPSPGLGGEGPAPARLPGGGLGEDVGRRRQPGGGAAQTRRHHQPLEREPAGPVRNQRPYRGKRPHRDPPARAGSLRRPPSQGRPEGETLRPGQAAPASGPRSACPPGRGLGQASPPSPLTRGPLWPGRRLRFSAGRAGGSPLPCPERLGRRQVVSTRERKGTQGRSPRLPQAMPARPSGTGGS